MKILHIISTIGKHAGDLVVALNYIRKMKSQDVVSEIAYIKLKDEDLVVQLEEEGILLHQIEKLNLTNFNKIKQQLEEIIKNGNYDVVHLHLCLMQKVVKSALKKFPNIKLIAHSHLWGRDKGFLKKIRDKILLSGITKNADGFLACSNNAGKFMFGDFFDTKKTNCQIIYNAFDIEKFKFSDKFRKEIRQEFAISENGFVVLHIGRFTEQKNNDYVLDVFKEVQKLNPNAVLLCVGNGKDKEKFLERVQVEKVKNVHISETRSDIEKLYSAADVFIFPSRFEGLGNVLIEAQANGLSCVASDRVPPETKCSDSIKYLPIDIDPKEWAKVVLESKRTNKTNMNNYDINEQFKSLINFYKQVTDK